MFKLVVVGGKLRGKEIVLNEGENTIGRSDECDHPIKVDGVSKKHLLITVNGDTAFAEDLGSANGTFVNEKLIKKVTLRGNDTVALPNVIFQLVYVTEKVIVVKKRILKGDDDDDSYDDLQEVEPMPPDLLGKPIWFFKHKIMPIVYSFNQQYEWAALVGILLFVFIAINITLTILPVLRDSRSLLVSEIAARGKQYAAEVDRFNNVYLRDKNLDQVYTGFLEGDDTEGVQSYKLFDTEGRVYRPVSELNTIVNDAFSVDAIKFYKDETRKDFNFIRDLGNNTIGIARAIKAHDKNLGRDVVVAIIALNFSPTTLAREASNNSKAYLESLLTSAMVAIIFFGILYYMTVRPLTDMRLQIERVLRGRQKELESKVLFKELTPLRNTINSVLSRMKDLQNAETGETQSIEEDSPYIRILKELMDGASGPVIILDSAKIIHHMNKDSEEMLGIRENASAGQSLIDTARDQGFAATVTEMCDKSANADGANFKSDWNMNGKDIVINVTALMGRDKFAKCFNVTLVRMS